MEQEEQDDEYIHSLVDSTEFAESVENHDFLSSLIKEPNNYP